MDNIEYDLIYVRAAEHMINLLTVMDQTLEFMNENSILPDEAVKKELQPYLSKYQDWLNNN